MKFLEIDNWYYKFPNGIETLEDFIGFLSDNYNSFIPMHQYQTDNCVFPYLIEDEFNTVYINVSKIDRICEVEGEILSRLDYDFRLEKIVRDKCCDCLYYEDDGDLIGHRNLMSLDGECIRYTKKNDKL